MLPRYLLSIPQVGVSKIRTGEPLRRGLLRATVAEYYGQTVEDLSVILYGRQFKGSRLRQVQEHVKDSATKAA
jgi:hypothetical protein